MRLAAIFATVGILLFSASTFAATPQADVIVLVDTSGSMDAEVAAFRSSINSLAAAISGAHVDLHVVLIGAQGLAGSLCVPAPLGSGVCPADEHLPGFRHVQQYVDSTNGLALLLSTYPQWAGSLRDVARKFIIILTDDNSDLSAASFDTQLHAKDAAFAGYSFNAMVVASPGCGAAIGTVYAQLVAQTGGILSNLCTEPIAIGLDRIAAAVSDGAGPPDDGALSCNLELNGTVFVNGNTVTSQVYRFANLTAAPVPVEFKIWLVAPGVGSIALVRAGADGSIVLPAGYNHDSGPKALFTISPKFPRGSYGYSCRMLDPVTGRVLAEDLNSFVVQ